MKKTTLLSLFMLPLLAFAQITVTEADLPDTGRTYLFADEFYPLSFTVDNNATGFQFWDFGNSFLPNDTTEWTFILPSATPYPADFPNAGLAIADDADSVYYYFKRTASGFYLDGLRMNNEFYRGKIDFNPDELQFPANFTYTDSVYDFSRTQVTVTQDQFTIRVIRRQEKWIKADGYGNIVTPEGFFQNVLRINTFMKATDSIFLQAGPFFIPISDTISYSTRYDWVQNGENALILNIITDSIGISPVQSQYSFGFVPVDSNLYVISVNDPVFCAGDSIFISYQSNINVNPDNIFLAQLSAPDGSFHKGYTLAMKADTASGTLRGIIPGNVPAVTSSDYRLRIMAGSPSVNGIPSSFNITVSGKPQLDIVWMETELCQGDSMFIAVFGADSVVWSPADGIRFTTDGHVMASPDVTTTYYITGYTACGSDSDSITIVVRPPLLVEAGANDTTCQGVPVQLNGSTSEPGAMVFWFPGDKLDDPATLNPVATTDESTMFYMIASHEGCFGMDSVHLQVWPEKRFLPISGNDNVLEGETATYSTSAQGNSFNWVITGGNQVSGGNSNVIEVEWATAGNGKVEVSEIGELGCEGNWNSRNITIQKPSFVDRKWQDRKLLLSPNPAREQVLLEYEDDAAFKWEISLFDLNGRKLYNAEGESARRLKHQLDIEKFPNGMYILQFMANDGVVIRKLLVGSRE